MTTNEMTFITTPGSGGGVYKPRVWVHRSHVGTDVDRALKGFSMWRGVDKHYGDWMSYECRQEQLDKAIAYLTSQGFKKERDFGKDT